jgi:hypothetical protein
MSGTVRTPAVLDAFFADNGAQDINASMLRDLVATMFQAEVLPSALGYAPGLENSYGPGGQPWVANRIGFTVAKPQISFSSLTAKFTITAAAAAGKKVKVVCYSKDSRGRALNKLAESADIAADATGEKTATLTFPGGPEWYWFGVTSDGTPSIVCVYAHQSSLGTVFKSTSDGTTNLTAYYDAPYGACPAVMGTLATSNGFYMCPNLLITANS